MRDSASKLFFLKIQHRKNQHKNHLITHSFDYRKPVLKDTLPYSSLDKIE